MPTPPETKAHLGFKVFMMFQSCLFCGAVVAVVVYRALQTPVEPIWVAMWAGMLPLAIVSVVINVFAVLQSKVQAAREGGGGA